MSFIDNARAALQALPISDIVRERLSLAVDRLAAAEAQVAELQAKIEVLQLQASSLAAQLERERLDHQQAREELQRLKEHSEEVRIVHRVEFRRAGRIG